MHPAPLARPGSLDAALTTWREAQTPTPPRPPTKLGLGQDPLFAPGRCGSPTHLATRQRSGSGSGSGSGPGGGGGGSSMAAAGVTAKAGGGTSSAAAAASLIRARGLAWPRRAVSCSLARGIGAPKCGSDSAPPPPLARRRNRSRRGHLGNGDRPEPGYGGRRGTSLLGRRRLRARQRTGAEPTKGGARGTAPGGGGVGDLGGGPGGTSEPLAPGTAALPRSPVFALGACALGCARPCSRAACGGRARRTPGGAARPGLGGDQTLKWAVSFSKWITAKGDAILRNRIGCNADSRYPHVGVGALGIQSPGRWGALMKVQSSTDT